MERYLREVIGNLLTLNNLPFYFWVYNVFVDQTYIWRFYTGDQIWLFCFVFWVFFKVFIDFWL